MFLQRLAIQQFRCFKEKEIEFTKQITLITGNNGTGKTSLLEAIHYLCYSKSFRSHLIQDLLHTNHDSFFLKGAFQGMHDGDVTQNSLQVGFFQKKKSIKINEKQITSYKQILSHLQVITLTEDDINIIGGYPMVRRAFIDQAILLTIPQAFDQYSAFRQVLQQRNAMLQSFKPIDRQELAVWDQALWQHSQQIQKYRVDQILFIEQAINELIEQFFDNVYTVSLRYEPKVSFFDQSFEQAQPMINRMFDQERIMKRSLFGAHLDDIAIQIKGKKARVYASRGQQKLISLLCKISLICLTSKQNTIKPIILIDDFISDFDQIRLSQLINFLISCKNQIILTAPGCDVTLENILKGADWQHLEL